jgi:hypothetical protein
MNGKPILTKPAAESVYAIPAGELKTTAAPIRDEETRLLRDEDGLTICGG